VGNEQPLVFNQTWANDPCHIVQVIDDMGQGNDFYWPLISQRDEWCGYETP